MLTQAEAHKFLMLAQKALIHFAMRNAQADMDPAHYGAYGFDIKVQFCAVFVNDQFSKEPEVEYQKFKNLLDSTKNPNQDIHAGPDRSKYPSWFSGHPTIQTGVLPMSTLMMWMTDTLIQLEIQRVVWQSKDQNFYSSEDVLRAYEHAAKESEKITETTDSRGLLCKAAYRSFDLLKSTRIKK
jgi:hypothetical protein